MDGQEVGPSNTKKLKCDLHTTKKLSNEKLEGFLNCSDDEDIFGSDVEDVLGENSSSSDVDSDNEPLENLVGIQAPTKAFLDWNDDATCIKKLPFTKVQQLLQQPQGNNPIDYFNLIVDQNFLELIVKQTNQYAAEVLCLEGKTEKSRITKWHDLTVSEFKIFLGLLLHTGTIPLTRLQDYWKKDYLFNIPCFTEHMSRNRFLLIMRCLHFAKNPEAGEPKPQDRLFKIRPVIDFFNNKMNSVFYPDRELSLDEPMVLWRGRLVSPQYIKNKRNKYGIKLYMVTTPNGIIIKFAVYMGVLEGMRGKEHAANVVLHLMSELLQNGHSLYMDNFYSSYDLAKQLLEKRTNCTGTLTIDGKDNPEEVKNKKLKKGETVAKYCNGVLIGKWRDKRDIHYISTEFCNNMVETRNKRGEVKNIPEAIVNYNKFMSGVDRQDQILSYYPCDRKTVRWPSKLFIHILQMCLVNAFLLYNTYSTNKMSFYDFRLSIIKELLGPRRAVSKSTKKGQHILRKCKISKGGSTLRRKCKTCKEKGKRRETTYECPACPDTPGYCLDCCKLIHE